MAEQWTLNPLVLGSTPRSPTDQSSIVPLETRKNSKKQAEQNGSGDLPLLELANQALASAWIFPQ